MGKMNGAVTLSIGQILNTKHSLKKIQMNEATQTTPIAIDMSQLTTEQIEAALNERRNAENTEIIAKRKAYEVLKKDTVAGLIKSAKLISATLLEFKEKSFSEMQTIYKMLQEYSKRHADGKGNFQLEHEGLRVSYRRQDNGFFDERSVQAEKHIIDFVTEKFVDDLDTKDLIMSLLERKKGTLDIKLVQKLYAMEERFTAPNWVEGIKLLKESWTVSDTKDYITFEEKDKTNKWVNINLNFSSI